MKRVQRDQAVTSKVYVNPDGTLTELGRAKIEYECTKNKQARREHYKRHGSKRKTALIALRAAGYHDDNATWLRVFVGARISRRCADEEWARGQQMRAAGVACSCIDCNGRPA